MTDQTDFLILGGGVSGLAAASLLGNRATVLERDGRPGGLVRSDCVGGYWFDRVLHLLYFPDTDTERRVRELLGEVLAPCPPVAWVETAAGVTRYPFQMHLAGLDRETITACLRDLAQATYGPRPRRASSFLDYLLHTFGRAMCDLFMLPYNRKMWRRPLDSLAPTDFCWNITPPDFESVVRGAQGSNGEFRPYNDRGWYPRPGRNSSLRGMEVLSAALADAVSDLRLRHAVESIDLDQRVVATRHQGLPARFRYRRCLCTLPLPTAVELCRQAPAELKSACRHLRRNRVLSVMLCVEGPRPTGTGHWRYYADESVAFTRLIYMHEFDPQSAPANGWGLMAEITQPAEDAAESEEAIVARVLADVRRVGGLPPGSRVIDTRLRVCNPAYVVFTPENASIISAARRFLRASGITPLGRYGRWEYSSMGQVMRDGFAWAERSLATLPARRRPVVRISPSLPEAVSA